MADLGQRSIQMNVVNATSANLTIQGVNVGSECTWVQGFAPKQGDTLGEFTSAQWAVSNDDYNSVATGTVYLTGLGAGMVQIQITNDNAGNSTCGLTGNNAVAPTSTAMPTNDANHSAFSVTLSPAPSSASAKA